MQMTAPRGGERQDALKARVYPASMPAAGGKEGERGGGRWGVFFPHLPGRIITSSQRTTRLSGCHGLTQCLAVFWTGRERINQKIVWTTLSILHKAKLGCL